LGLANPTLECFFLAVPTLAFLGVSARIANRWAFFRPTLRQRLCGPHFAAGESLERMTMAKQTFEFLALRPREAAKTLGIGPRTLWGLTAPRGPIPCVRVGHGNRQTVLYPVADLQAWLSRQAGTDAQDRSAQEGGNQ
jgi:hypothetical protein